jgi:dihydroxyacetone kinase
MSARSVSDALIYAATNVQDIGGARLGDKTLVDVLTPFSESFALCVDRGRTVGQAWQESSREADINAKNTANLVPKIGRAKNHAERGIGVPDAGAVSLARLVARVGKILEKTGVGNV